MQNYKDIILDSVSMEEVLNQYGIKTNRTMFSCPFHGIDKTPSAKAYKNSFHCFCCQKTGDLIQFVEDYYNLSFFDAMKKINYDFGLGVGLENINKEELERRKLEIQLQKEEREYKKKQYNLKMKSLCNQIHNLEDMIYIAKNNINPFSWEKDVKMITCMELELNKLEFEFEQNLR